MLPQNRSVYNESIAAKEKDLVTQDLVADAPYCAIQILQTYTLPVGLRAGLTGRVGDAYSEKVTSWLAGEGGTHPLVGHHLRPFFSDIYPVSG